MTDDHFTIYAPDGEPIFSGTAAEVVAFITDEVKRDTSGAALNPED